MKWSRHVPSAYVATMTKAKRNGKIFIDFFRNDYTATAIADYAVRARPGAPVALPLVLEGTGRSGIRKPVHDEGCAGAAEEQEAAQLCPTATTAAQVMKQACTPCPP